MMRVILNPMARGGAGRAVRAEIERALAGYHSPVEVVETTRAGEGTELARSAVLDGVRVIVAAGGDGTIHEVANGVLQATESEPDHDVAFGIIPTGTGNDFAKVVPGCRSKTQALATLLTGQPRRFDVGHAAWSGSGEYFLNAMGTGVDVEVVRQIQLLSRGTGAMVYVQGLVRALAIYKPLPLHIRYDDAEVEARIMMVAVANGRCIGGSFNITPHARPDDGRLDLCIVHEVSLAGQLVLVPRIVTGTHESSRKVEARQVRSVTFRAVDGRPLFFQLDGELREPPDATELTISIRPARLNVITNTQPQESIRRA